MTFEEMRDILFTLRVREHAAGAKVFLGIPERWYDTPKWRCQNNHISTIYLKS